MSWPTNDTGLSLAAVVKWLVLIVSVSFWISAYHGIVERQVAPSKNLVLQGHEAVVYGWKQVGWGFLCIAIAWAIWFFWQRNED